VLEKNAVINCVERSRQVEQNKQALRCRHGQSTTSGFQTGRAEQRFQLSDEADTLTEMSAEGRRCEDSLSVAARKAAQAVSKLQTGWKLGGMTERRWHRVQAFSAAA
jgi:hypothetical protein